MQKVLSFTMIQLLGLYLNCLGSLLEPIQKVHVLSIYQELIMLGHHFKFN